MILRAFLHALQFLTVLPVPARASFDDDGRSLVAWPLVGAMIGVLLCGVAVLSGVVPPAVGAALVVAAWAGFTGGLHLDGVADTADGWIGGAGDRQRTLAIMKDPRAGAAAVVAVVAVLLLKFAAVMALLEAGRWGLLLLPPVLGRTAAVALLLTTDYVRVDGLGAAMAKHMPRRGCVAASLTAVAACAVFALYFGGWRAALSVCLLPAAVLLLWRASMVRRLGGTTGDTAGAAVELVEVAALVALSAAVI